MPQRVLLVEDSATMRGFVTSALESGGNFHVTAAPSGFEALKILPRASYDVIITDINMPDINGLELINFVKKNPNYRQTPLFIITTEGRDQDKARGLALGAAEYLIKPFEPRNLEGLLKRYLKIA